MRIWLDLTCIAQGSDAAVVASCLGAALAKHAELHLCRREPGLVELDRACLTQLAQPPHANGRPSSRPLRALAQRLPPLLRASLGRFALLQIEALRLWRALLARPASRAGVAPGDAAALRPGDILVLLSAAGDASRFAAQGVRLIECAIAPAPPASAAVWRSTTAPLIEQSLTQRVAGAATTHPVPRVNPDLILCLDEIGLHGHTDQLLHAWRRLMETRGAAGLPVLVLAGPMGLGAQDCLTQITNSDGLGGHIRLAPHVSPVERAALLARAWFNISLGDHSAWSRARSDCEGAGVAVLCGVDGQVADLADAVSAWLDNPPPFPPCAARSWDNVAGDVMSALAR
jgi:hypothetical protein